MNVRPADPRSHSDSEFHFSEQPQLSEELRMLREQVRRFVEKEVVPHGEQWERDGKIPREIYRRMGALGFLGMRHAAEYGGTDMGPLASMVWAEELGRSTFGGFHLVGAGAYRHVGGPHHPARHAGAKAEISARDHPRRDDLLDRGDRARCRLRRCRVEDAGPPRRRFLGDQRLEDVHHQCGLWRHPDRRRAHRSRSQGQPRHVAVHRRADDARHIRDQTRQARLALLRHRRDRLSGCPHPRWKICWARRTAASMASWKPSRTSGSASAASAPANPPRRSS